MAFKERDEPLDSMPGMRFEDLDSPPTPAHFHYQLLPCELFPRDPNLGGGNGSINVLLSLHRVGVPRTASLRGKVATSPTRVAPTTASVRGTMIRRGYWWVGTPH